MQGRRSVLVASMGLTLAKLDTPLDHDYSQYYGSKKAILFIRE